MPRAPTKLRTYTNFMYEATETHTIRLTMVAADGLVIAGIRNASQFADSCAAK
jgi:hypothetical protein